MTTAAKTMVWPTPEYRCRNEFGGGEGQCKRSAGHYGYCQPEGVEFSKMRRQLWQAQDALLRKRLGPGRFVTRWTIVLTDEYGDYSATSTWHALGTSPLDALVRLISEEEESLSRITPDNVVAVFHGWHDDWSDNDKWGLAC